MKKIVSEYKVFDKFLLIEANEAAYREERNRCIDRSVLEKLPTNEMYLVIESFLHQKSEMRLKVKLGKGEAVYLDVSYLRFESLPIVRFYKNGSHDTEFFKRPYPNGREWKEIVVRKPVRKQSSFRRKILSAYDNCCALCDIRDKSLLRAAHIVDVKDGGMDTIDNGICLCVNHEIAFDNGKIRINPDYTINVITGIGGTQNKINLPSNSGDYPSSELLRKKLWLIDQKK